MKKIIICIAILFFKCFEIAAQDNILRSINSIVTLEMTFVDDKCGEWGGNETTVKIYRQTLRGPILADISIKTMDCFGKQETKVAKEKQAIILNEMTIQLVTESIQQLSLQKLNNSNIITRSGFHSKAKLSDSSLVIDDFPSQDWSKFKQLCTELEK